MLRRLGKYFRRLGRDRKGSVTLEFAVALLPFMILLMGTFELGLLIFENSVVEGATREAARKVRTGAVQSNADPLGTFQQAFCTALFGIYTCSGFSYDVRSFSDFPAITLPPIQFDAQGNPSNAVFQPGGAGTVVTVRVVRRHTFFTPLIGTMMGAGTSNSLPVTATAVLKTEPYQ
ncbi:Flp pilus assembly protein TadG [Candidatus Terasakiella magnetica]|nr:Flp pilus assembly protein TadG [Candidatus Terasakiella magnetica]